MNAVLLQDLEVIRGCGELMQVNLSLTDLIDRVFGSTYSCREQPANQPVTRTCRQISGML